MKKGLENAGLECMRNWARAAAESKPGYGGLCLHSNNSGGRVRRIRSSKSSLAIFEVSLSCHARHTSSKERKEGRREGGEERKIGRKQGSKEERINLQLPFPGKTLRGPHKKEKKGKKQSISKRNCKTYVFLGLERWLCGQEHWGHSSGGQGFNS